MQNADTEDERHRALIDLVYRAALRRPADAAGFQTCLEFLRGGGSWHGLLENMLGSDEFVAKRLVASAHALSPGGVDDTAVAATLASRFETADVESLSDLLKDFQRFDADTFDHIARTALDEFAGALGGQDGYLQSHTRRFRELANIVAGLMAHAGTPVQADILDFGFSVNSCVLRKIFPDAALSVCDRPQIRWAEDFGFKLFTVDLAGDDLDDVTLGRAFDVIVFAEVLEHVLSSPVRMLRFLLRHLKVGGRIVLTTPNYFRRACRRDFASGRNPQPIYPEAYRQNDSPHFHVREYALLELLEIAEAAGGRASAFFYSGCWDDETAATNLGEAELGNLVVVIERQTAAVADFQAPDSRRMPSGFPPMEA